jgi:hypothetical protein
MRRLNLVVIWVYLGCCVVFVLFPRLVPISLEPDSIRGLTSQIHIRPVRGMSGCDCYTYAWSANVYDDLRMGILWGAVPFVLALIFWFRTRQPNVRRQ